MIHLNSVIYSSSQETMFKTCFFCSLETASHILLGKLRRKFARHTEQQTLPAWCFHIFSGGHPSEANVVVDLLVLVQLGSWCLTERKDVNNL